MNCGTRHYLFSLQKMGCGTHHYLPHRPYLIFQQPSPLWLSRTSLPPLPLSSLQQQNSGSGSSHGRVRLTRAHARSRGLCCSFAYYAPGALLIARRRDLAGSPLLQIIDNKNISEELDYLLPKILCLYLHKYQKFASIFCFYMYKYHYYRKTRLYFFASCGCAATTKNWIFRIGAASKLNL